MQVDTFPKDITTAWVTNKTDSANGTNWVQGRYANKVDLTKVNTITYNFTVYSTWTNWGGDVEDAPKNYYSNITVNVGVAKGDTGRLDSSVSTGGQGSGNTSTPLTWSYKKTLDVSSLTGEYYIGCEINAASYSGYNTSHLTLGRCTVSSVTFSK